MFLVAVLSFFALIVVVAGVSYGVYTFIGTGTKENSISTGSLSISYSDSESVKLITTKIGKSNAKEIRFTVNAVFDTPTTLYYDIVLDHVLDTEGILEDKNIRYSLTKITNTSEIEKVYEERVEDLSILEAINNNGIAHNKYAIDSDSFITSGKYDYVLKVWIDDNYKLPINDSIGEYSFKIRSIATLEQK